MRIDWQIDGHDIKKVRELYERHKGDAFVRKRVERNLSENRFPIGKGLFWERMTGCLLTTQQRSGPNSPIARFMSRPFTLDYDICQNQGDLAEFARAAMSAFGGIRRSNIIGKQLAANLSYLERGGWERVFACCDELRDSPGPQAERQAADFIDDNLSGFGPKQSRNLLQWLGVSPALRFRSTAASRDGLMNSDFRFA